MSLTTAYLTMSNVFGAVAFGVGAIGIVYGVLKCCSRGRRPLYTRRNLEHKVAIVTGANAGIGFETALGLAETNARVILACRDASKGESAAAEVRQKTGNGNVVFRELNLASISSIRHFAARILEEETSLDILVNNAGIIESNGTRTEDGFELIFGVNHLGHFHLTNLLLDRLKESPSARIVVVSSYVQGYKERLDFDLVNEYDVRRIGTMSVTYLQSKLANVLFTRALAKRLEGTKVTVNALHPGFVSTGMVGHMNIPAWRKPLIMFIARLIFKTPKQGARTSLYCALSEDIEGLSGRFFSDCQEVTLTTPGATNEEDAERLWEISSSLVEDVAT